jgi:Tfp pilus assembly protein PilO
MLKKFSDKEIKNIYILTALAALVLLYVFVVKPSITRWNDIDRKTEAAKTKLQKSIALMQEKRNIDNEYGMYEKNLKLRGSNEQEMAHILNELESIARQANVKITSIRPMAMEEKEYYRQFEVELEIESQIGALMSFIYYLKNSPQFIRVEKLNLSAGGAQAVPAISTTIIISKIALD